MQVRVYRNLTKKCWSIQHKTTDGWRLYRHASSLELLNVETKVYHSSRLRGLSDGKKYVHAYLVGELNQSPFARIYKPIDSQRVRYNPKDGYFRQKGDYTFISSNLVLCDQDGHVFYDCLPVGSYDVAREVNPLNRKLGD